MATRQPRRRCQPIGLWVTRLLQQKPPDFDPSSPRWSDALRRSALASRAHEFSRFVDLIQGWKSGIDVEGPFWILDCGFWTEIPANLASIRNPQSAIQNWTSSPEDQPQLNVRCEPFAG